MSWNMSLCCEFALIILLWFKIPFAIVCHSQQSSTIIAFFYWIPLKTWIVWKQGDFQHCPTQRLSENKGGYPLKVQFNSHQANPNIHGNFRTDPMLWMSTYTWTSDLGKRSPKAQREELGKYFWGCRQCTSPAAFCLSGCSENTAVTTKATACQCLCTGREQKGPERPGQVNGAISQPTRCGSSAEFPGATRRVGSLPAASWSLTSQRHQCVKTLISTGIWSPFPLGPPLLTLFRGTLKWKMLRSCETHSWSHHQASVYWGSKESFTSCTPSSTWPPICIGLFQCCIIHSNFHNWVCRDFQLHELKFRSQNFIFHGSECSFRCPGSFGASYHMRNCVGQNILGVSSLIFWTI